MTRWLLALTSLLISAACVAAPDAPDTGWSLGGETAPDGTPVQCVLPPERHIRNTGGNDRTRSNPLGLPGQGSGLCVFTSAELACRWHNEPALDGLQKWMTKRPGGGWPEKLDQMVKAFCLERGVEAPKYIQVTGSRDLDILRLACKTGRYPCIRVTTLPGYRGSIDHMVNLSTAGVGGNWSVQDNNFPGQWSHMTEAEFQRAYGGWSVIFLSPGPPPAPKE